MVTQPEQAQEMLATLLAANVSLMKIIGELNEHELAMLQGKHDGHAFFGDIVKEIGGAVTYLENPTKTFNLILN